MFSVNYVSRVGWVIHLNGERWGMYGHRTEWLAIEELAQTHPVEARELEMVHQSVG